MQITSMAGNPQKVIDQYDIEFDIESPKEEEIESIARITANKKGNNLLKDHYSGETTFLKIKKVESINEKSSSKK